MMDGNGLHRLVESCVEDGVWAGGVLGIVHRDGRRCLWPHGRQEFHAGDRVRADAIFDLASLTKVVGTTTAVMRLVDAGRLDLDDPVGAWLPEFVDAVPEQRARREQVRIRHLLAHASGLPAYVPFHQQRGLRPARRRACVLSVPLEADPGTRTTYSDVGFLTLGFLLETLTGLSLSELVAREVTTPLGMLWTRFRPPPAWRRRIMPTEVPHPDAPPLRGRVHDENAHWLGGVAGHAGLFSTVDDLARLAHMVLNLGRIEGDLYLSEATIAAFTRPAAMVPGSSRCLGWDSPEEPCSGGKWLHETSFGHTGFTGTSLWMDPHAGLAVILLTNAVYPRRETRVERGFFVRRRRVHSAVYEALGLT